MLSKNQEEGELSEVLFLKSRLFLRKILKKGNLLRAITRKKRELLLKTKEKLAGRKEKYILLKENLKKKRKRQKKSKKK